MWGYSGFDVAVSREMIVMALYATIAARVWKERDVLRCSSEVHVTKSKLKHMSRGQSVAACGAWISDLRQSFNGDGNDYSVPRNTSASLANKKYNDDASNCFITAFGVSGLPHRLHPEQRILLQSATVALIT